MAPATVSGFIIPDGDSFPRTTTTTHAVVAPPNNVASDLAPIPSASITTSHTVTSSTTATATPITDGSSTPFPPAAIAGIILAILTIIGVLFFFVRRHFIHKRASKTTPAHARARAASQVGISISGPIDFQHVSSADAPVWNTEDKVSMNVSMNASATATTAQVGRPKPAAKAANESANKEKYTVNFGEMESGLNDHVRAMQFARQDSF